MATRYLSLSDQEPAACATRLGLAVADLLDDAHDQAAVHERLLGLALSPGGTYAARDVLDHPASAARLTDQQTAELTRLVRASGLGRGSMPADIHADVLQSVEASLRTLHSGTSGQGRSG